jgi:hypothetical protein
MSEKPDETLNDTIDPYGTPFLTPFTLQLGGGKKVKRRKGRAAKTSQRDFYIRKKNKFTENPGKEISQMLEESSEMHLSL